MENPFSELKQAMVDGDTTNSNAPVDETKPNTESGDVDVPSSEVKEGNDLKKDPSIDYAKELSDLQKIKEERDNYKAGMLNAKEQLKEMKRGEKPSDELEERLAKIEKVAIALEESQQKWQASQRDENVGGLIASISSNPDEQRLIKYHYENSIVQSGHGRDDIISDLENAWAIANKRRIERQNSELKASLKAKSTLNTAPAVSSHKARREPELNVSDREASFLDRYGATEQYKKNLKKK